MKEMFTLLSNNKIALDEYKDPTVRMGLIQLVTALSIVDRVEFWLYSVHTWAIDNEFDLSKWHNIDNFVGDCRCYLEVVKYGVKSAIEYLRYCEDNKEE